jgi:hypothetical protein
VLYLFIMVLVAAAGITRLWLQQRKDNTRMNSVDGFREGLERIAGQQRPRPQDPRQAARRPARRPVAPRRMTSGLRPQPLDPARREAAKRRIEARRRARQRVA